MKKPKKINVVQKYKDACEDVARVFMAKYYSEYEYTQDSYWVADEIGGVFYICDEFYNIDRMIQALELNCPPEKLYEYQDMESEHYQGANSDKPLRINFKNYVKWGLLDK
mgnify:CR=1 FL=1|jgi:hypothetical protein|tara:strand:+ start:978 stop:1307 length:330 start_codon:yes stop_codon:yes gene_type:complete